MCPFIVVLFTNKKTQKMLLNQKNKQLNVNTPHFLREKLWNLMLGHEAERHINIRSKNENCMKLARQIR